MYYYLHYIPVSLYAVCTDIIELVPSSDPVVMETIKKASSSNDTTRYNVDIFDINNNRQKDSSYIAVMISTVQGVY